MKALLMDSPDGYVTRIRELPTFGFTGANNYPEKCTGFFYKVKVYSILTSHLRVEIFRPLAVKRVKYFKIPLLLIFSTLKTMKGRSYCHLIWIPRK